MPSGCIAVDTKHGILKRKTHTALFFPEAHSYIAWERSYEHEYSRSDGIDKRSKSDIECVGGNRVLAHFFARWRHLLYKWLLPIPNHYSPIPSKKNIGRLFFQVLS